MGARFAKWRAVIAVGEGIPSRGCVEGCWRAVVRRTHGGRNIRLSRPVEDFIVERHPADPKSYFVPDQHGFAVPLMPKPAKSPDIQAAAIR
jgi:hypothetical protein